MLLSQMNREQFEAWCTTNFPVKDPLYIYPEGEVPNFKPEEIPDQDAPSLTPYVVWGYKVRPAMIVLPGGGFTYKSPLEAETVAEWFKVHGIHAFVMNYRVAPYKMPTTGEDILRAVQYLRAHAEELNIDPNHIGVVGFSAGGYYTGFAATRFRPGDPESADPVARVSSRPDAAIMCYPACALSSMPGAERLLERMLEDPTMEGGAEYLDHTLNVPEDAPPVMLFHTAADPLVNVHQSLAMADALHAKNVPVEVHIFPFGRHGLDLAFDTPHVNQWATLAINFLRYFGFSVPVDND